MEFAGKNFPDAFPLPIPQSSGSLFLFNSGVREWLHRMRYPKILLRYLAEGGRIVASLWRPFPWLWRPVAQMGWPSAAMGLRSGQGGFWGCSVLLF